MAMWTSWNKRTRALLCFCVCRAVTLPGYKEVFDAHMGTKYRAAALGITGALCHALDGAGLTACSNVL